MEFLESVPLAPLTTFKIGGPARWFAEARCVADVLAAIQFSRTRHLPLFILGGGSNLLIADRGFDGLVLRMASTGITEVDGRAGYRTFSVAAGEVWDELVSHLVVKECGGIECLAGIPGTVGGTPIQNVGAYGQEASDTICKVKVLDLANLEILDLDSSACEFGYRRSIFNQQCAGRYVILSVDFRLLEHAPARVGYHDLKEFFKDVAGDPGLARTASAVREIRRRKGMILVNGDPDTQSAGSFFKNPVVSLIELAEVAKAADKAMQSIPQFSAGEGMVKIPAAWLVERAGIQKAYRKGNAAISSRHTLALTNRGGASAAEILALRDEIQSRVESRFGIRLTMEPIMVGF